MRTHHSLNSIGPFGVPYLRLRAHSLWAFPIAVALLILCARHTEAAVTWPVIDLTPIAEGFNGPVHLAHAGDGSGRLFVVERGGLIRILQDGEILAPPFLDIRDRITPRTVNCHECGLLGLVFPPDFADQGYFFVFYNGNAHRLGLETGDPDGVFDIVLARYRISADPNLADRDSEEPVLLQAKSGMFHNGGQMAFGPDGYLYVGVGDGSSRPNGQNLSTLFGKILRIEVGATGAYTVPSTNPFVGNDAVRPEIWAYGLRNPWRFSFDPQTGDLYIGDVGDALYEEINFQPSSSPGGENYGWSVMEGNQCFGADTCDSSGLTLPVVDYAHQFNCSSVTAGMIYDSPEAAPVFLFSDFCDGDIRGLQRDGDEWVVSTLHETLGNITTFGVDEAGNVYAVDYSGLIYRVFAPLNQLYIPSLSKVPPSQ